MSMEPVHGNARLVINPGTPDAWAGSLHPGVNKLGRTPDNDLVLEHASISSCHCEIVISKQGARLKDLGSTNGTFVDGQLVEEVVLIPGQRLQIGNVESVFEWTLPEPAGNTGLKQLASNSRMSEQKAGSQEISSEPHFCKFHVRSQARFLCPKCQRGFCELCISTRPQGGAIRRYCRNCGVECRPLIVSSSPEPQPPGFLRLALGAFAYPFKGDGLILLAAGTIAYGLLDAASLFAGFAALFGFVAISFISLFGMGYLTAYMRRILTSSATGEGSMPDWPDFSDFGSDILSPCLQLLATLVVCFAPALILATLLEGEHAWKDAALGFAYLLGAAYFPMAFLAVAMFDTVAALNPILIVPSIVKVGKEYLVVLLLFVVILGARSAEHGFMSMRMPLLLRLFSLVLSGFLSLYLATVAMRLLGLLYLCKKHTLGWFPR